MKNLKRSPEGAFSFFLKFIGGGVALSILLIFPLAHAGSISGKSTTILRMGRTTDDRNIYPLYEYLDLGVSSEAGNGVLSANVGGWGRTDLRDRSAEDRTEGALQHGAILYSGNNSNLMFKAGRQFVSEGVATERIDGLYLRNDFIGGLGASVFVGSPVVTEPDFKGGDLTYGGRIAHSMDKYYTIGVSAMRTDQDSEKIREEAGFDVWIHPLPQIDITGRSSYNNITSDWMEHAYSVTVNPFDILRITADISGINYRDYFYQVTTKALSLSNGIINRNEKLLTAGGVVELLLGANVRIAADYKDYNYDIAGAARYYGGKITFLLPDSFAAGLSMHRMDGDNTRFRYDEYRAFAAKIIGNADITLDFFDVKYENSINGVDNTYSAAAAVGYKVTDALKLSADVDYGKSIDFDKDVKGLIKLTWAFDREYGKKGGQSEK